MAILDTPWTGHGVLTISLSTFASHLGFSGPRLGMDSIRLEGCLSPVQTGRGLLLD